ncbi:MAG: ComF family protein [Muribaculaceae bacterium]|nr:ComF family protein [Muribaculaceae bacterium]
MNPFGALLDLFIPRVCHVCGCKLVAQEEFICTDCIAKLPVTGYQRYWLNTSSPNSDLNPMEQRFAGQLPLLRACSPYFYSRDSVVSHLVHDFKYRGFSRLAERMGYLGALTLKDSTLFDGVDLLLPVPLHWRKKLRRGYNQSEMIARGISLATGIPLGTNLVACRSHRTQTSLSAAQRIANTRGVFVLRHPETLRGKNVMLVDDICTTGATLLSAGEAVAASQPDIRISIFTLGVV